MIPSQIRWHRTLSGIILTAKDETRTHVIGESYVFDGDGESHWLVRIIGGLIIAGATFLLLEFWDSLRLPVAAHLGIAGGLGVVFVLVGGNLLEWIREIDFWT